jgi:hypothetical protein
MIFPLVFGVNSGPRRTFTDRVPKGMRCIEIYCGVVEGKKGTRRKNAKISEFRENLLPVTVSEAEIAVKKRRGNLSTPGTLGGFQ